MLLALAALLTLVMLYAGIETWLTCTWERAKRAWQRTNHPK